MKGLEKLVKNVMQGRRGMAVAPVEALGLRLLPLSVPSFTGFFCCSELT